MLLRDYKKQFFLTLTVLSCVLYSLKLYTRIVYYLFIRYYTVIRLYTFFSCMNSHSSRRTL